MPPDTSDQSVGKLNGLLSSLDLLRDPKLENDISSYPCLDANESTISVEEAYRALGVILRFLEQEKGSLTIMEDCCFHTQYMDTVKGIMSRLDVSRSETLVSKGLDQESRGECTTGEGVRSPTTLRG